MVKRLVVGFKEKLKRFADFTLLSKLKISHQILSIMAVMLISSIVLGFVCLNIIGKMKKAANGALTDSNGILYNVSVVRGTLIKLNADYSQAVVDNRTAMVNTADIMGLKS